MKIGIMSMQRVINYGSFLQALGLKTILEELGHEVTFVDFREGILNNPSSEKNKNTFSLRKYRKLIVRILHYIPYVNKIKKIAFRYNYYKFNRDYVNKYLPSIGIEKKRQYAEKVDILIIGSDEVFNCLHTKPQCEYPSDLFGQNQNAGKIISYAASFGNTTLERMKQKGMDTIIAKYLQDFSELSVRDANSCEIVNALIGKKPQMHLDPVLVSDLSKYVIDNVKIKDYIIVYAYMGRIGKEEFAEIRKFAQRYNKQIVCFHLYTMADQYIGCSPYEILAYFKHADFVITDTFHGSIFSIINKRPFATLIRESDGEKYGNREKLADLLERLELMERQLSELKAEELEVIMDKNIDYTQTEQIIQKERQRAREYLKSELSN